MFSFMRLLIKVLSGSSRSPSLREQLVVYLGRMVRLGTGWTGRPGRLVGIITANSSPFHHFNIALAAPGMVVGWKEATPAP